MANQAKLQQVDEVAQKLTDSKSAALIQYQGLDAAGIASLRDKVRSKGGKIEVVKNTLITRALEKIGLTLPQNLEGPTAITYCMDDEISPLKEVEKVNKDFEAISFKYGIYEKKLLSVDDLKKFLSLPSKSALIAQFIGGLKNPMSRLAYALRFNQTQLVLTLKAIADKQGK